MIRFDQKFASKQVITELSAEHSSALLLIRPWKHMRLDATCWLFVEEGLLSVQKTMHLQQLWLPLLDDTVRELSV